jgi:hypothetical protein
MYSVVLLLWIFVVHNRSLWVLAFMGFLLFAEIAIVATLLAKSFSNFRGAFLIRRLAVEACSTSRRCGTLTTWHYLLSCYAGTILLSHSLVPSPSLPRHSLWAILSERAYGV